MTDEKTKKCTGCKRELPFSDFHNDASAPDGKNSYCKECRAAYYVTGSYGKKARIVQEYDPMLIDECLNSCLERLREIEENIKIEQGSAEAVKTVIIEVLEVNNICEMKNPKSLSAGSIKYSKGKLKIELEPWHRNL